MQKYSKGIQALDLLEGLIADGQELTPYIS